MGGLPGLGPDCPSLELIGVTGSELGCPGCGCLKSFKKRDLKYDIGYASDPDLWDRGRLRFLELNVSGKLTNQRTSSLPPRIDDPNNLKEKNQ